MKPVKLFKVLANDTRLQILRWLRDPNRYFGDQLAATRIKHPHFTQVGVCVQFIQIKSGLSQSTISQFLSMLQDAELITATRIGQWTYYKRDEEAISRMANYFAAEL